MLMALLRDYLVDERSEILDNGIRLVSIGNTDKLPDFVREPLFELQEASAHNKGMKLCLALSYGGREAIVDAAAKLVEKVLAGEIREQDVNALSFAEALCTHALPPLDLVIRTSGERRLGDRLPRHVPRAARVLQHDARQGAGERARLRRRRRHGVRRSRLLAGRQAARAARVAGRHRRRRVSVLPVSLSRYGHRLRA